MNIFAVVGNVANEPELRHTSQGRALCTFRLAVSRPADDQYADFFEVVTWERQAEVCKQYLTIGRRVAIEGRMRCRVHDLEDGVQRTSLELVASRVELVGPRRIETPARATRELAEVAR